ncbi:MAG: prepilin-type N-terminal cleavage/methylation domain-containing protein [Candidatus Eremiobacteraeota bacterium]|nr:prepilin-type N-terminal cleavage/methylation domain-containing protein [Candidatus Eremiobacteraeota bacterium]
MSIARYRRHRGFSIVELMVSLGILGVIIAIIIPNFNNYTASATCRNAALILYQDVLAMRQRAQAISFDTGIDISPPDPSGSSPPVYTLWESDDLEETVIKRVDLSRLFSKEIRFYFNPPSPSSDLRFTPSRTDDTGSWKFAVANRALTIIVECGQETACVSVDSDGNVILY